MNELLARTPDEDVIAEMADPFNEAVDHMINEQDEEEDEAMDEMMSHGGTDDADIVLDQSLEENPLTEAEMNAPDDPLRWMINVFGEGGRTSKVVECSCGKPLAKGESCPICKMSNK